MGFGGEAEDFAERYLQSVLPKQADVVVRMHERHEMASAVTPVTGSAFAIINQAIQETLARDRVSIRSSVMWSTVPCWPAAV